MVEFRFLRLHLVFHSQTMKVARVRARKRCLVPNPSLLWLLSRLNDRLGLRSFIVSAREDDRARRYSFKEGDKYRECHTVYLQHISEYIGRFINLQSNPSSASTSIMDGPGLPIDSKHPNFELPVDSENKATELRLLSIAKPHMRTFHLSWVSFFACFVSTFAAPPLLPVIRDDLNLTATDIGNAGIASVSGAVFARVAMGTACDLVGPRLASACLILLTAPAVYFFSAASSPVSFLLVRFFTGFSLATFVSTQFWMSSMFSASLVGTANGIAAGWGNLGGGATQLIMPLVYELIRKIGATEFTAWRIAFFIPATFQTLTALCVLIFGQDLPDGNYNTLQKSGEKTKDQFSHVLYHGITNYRGWILAMTYGYCFGVELTVDNIIAEYFYDKFDLKLHTAGIIAASFGLANLFSRPAGGLLSDFMARRFGMRGRLWSLWVVQTLGGVLCLLLGRVASLGPSITVMLVFSVFVQAACGLTFGIVPFVSRRQVIRLNIRDDWSRRKCRCSFNSINFLQRNQILKRNRYNSYGCHDHMLHPPYMLDLLPTMGWDVLCGPSKETTKEEDYYLSEWNSKERENGLHLSSSKFAENSRGERGRKVDAT
ncbi:hypothetical protein Scep_017862 [Stephania cephalantha]|uniref:Uncharacterized protein n=1 Tax=Stephania cephalantha TaxID=152367 RepID=A0AAP0NVB6_9MAGN